MFQNVFGYAAPYFRVRNAQQGIITETKGGFTNDFKSNIDVDLPIGTEDVSFFEHIEIAPNPTAGNTYFRFDLIKNTSFRLSITLSDGRVVWEHPSSFFEHGRSEVELPTNDFPAGVYFLKIENGLEILTRRLVVQR